LDEQLPLAGTPQHNRLIDRQIPGSDRQIDPFVYEVYGLTDEKLLGKLLELNLGRAGGAE